MSDEIRGRKNEIYGVRGLIRKRVQKVRQITIIQYWFFEKEKKGK